MNESAKKENILDTSVFLDDEPNSEDIWGGDAFARDKKASELTSLIRRAETPFVLALHGEWGSGKTYLLRRWKMQLEKEKAKVVYFNAWEDDFCGDPFIAIIGQLRNVFKGSDWEEITKSAASLIPWVKEKTLAAAGLEKENLQSVSEKVFDEYMEVRENLDALRNTLSELAKDKTGMPLVFIIDELDRCRPTFALETLERVKHIFNVKNVVFVLGINKKQLAKSVKSLYGDIGGEGYLQRFFDHEITLLASPSVYYKHIFDKMNMHGLFRQSPRLLAGWHPALGKDFAIIADYMNLSLRQVNNFARMITGILNEKEKHSPSILPNEGWGVVFLAFLRIKYPELYQDFVDGNIKSKDVINKILELFPDYEYDPKQNREYNSIVDCKNMIEGIFYLFADEDKEGNAIQHELHAIAHNLPTPKPLHLSERTKKLGKPYAEQVLERFIMPHDNWIPLKSIARMLDIGMNE